MSKKALGASNVRLPNVRKLFYFSVLSLLFFAIGSTASAKEAKKLPATYADTTIRGRVVDSLNNPLVGVSVVVKGTTNGTVTNISGQFTLTNVPANATLVISNIGYEHVEVHQHVEEAGKTEEVKEGESK